jgi:ubiquinone/menaquinone biosynthesis C-methylase UbiE
MAGPAGAASFTSPDAYDRHVGRYARALAPGLLREAGVAPGMRALDVGCGPGAVTGALTEILGADHVAAVDPSEPFVAACRERVPGADVRIGTAEALPFADTTFDAVLCQLVINFIPDAPGAVREMRRVARAGATIGAAVWDYSGGMTLLRRFWDAAAAVDPAAAALRAALGAPAGPFTLDARAWTVVGRAP